MKAWQNGKFFFPLELKGTTHWKKEYKRPKRTTRKASGILPRRSRPTQKKTCGSTSGLTVVLILILEWFLGKETTSPHTSLHLTTLLRLLGNIKQVITYLTGIVSRLNLIKKIFSRKNLQPTGSTSKDQAILVRHSKQTWAFLGQLLGWIKDPHLLQCSKLKILLWGIKTRSIQGRTGN